MTTSQPNVDPGVDAEDSVFGDSSSESSYQSDPEDPQDSSDGSDSHDSHFPPVTGPEDLVPNLQQNVNTLNGLIAEVTRRSALRRATLQLSNVSNQIASITQQLTSTWQSNPDNLQDQPTGQAMDSAPNQDADSSIRPSFTSRTSRHIGPQVSQSQSDQNPPYQYAPAPPAYREAAMADGDSLSRSENPSLHFPNSARIAQTSSRRSQREQRRRQETGPVLGSREEVESLGAPFPDSLARLYEQQSHISVNHARSIARRQWALGTATGSAAHSGDHLNTGDPSMHARNDVANEDLIDFNPPTTNQPRQVQSAAASVNHDAEPSRIWRPFDHYDLPYFLDYPGPDLDPGLALPAGVVDGTNHGQLPNVQIPADRRASRPLPTQVDGESRTPNPFPDLSAAPLPSFSRNATQQHQDSWRQQTPVDIAEYNYLRTSAESLHRHERMTQMLARRVRQPAAPRPQPNLDTDTTRPEPVAEEAKMIKMECKICFLQVIVAPAAGVVQRCGRSTLKIQLAPLIIVRLAQSAATPSSRS
ncbi:MAG: hypothetical protein Q9174_000107 [Haloplaca sp. 1 TL-2023]